MALIHTTQIGFLAGRQNMGPGEEQMILASSQLPSHGLASPQQYRPAVEFGSLSFCRAQTYTAQISSYMFIFPISESLAFLIRVLYCARWSLELMGQQTWNSKGESVKISCYPSELFPQMMARKIRKPTREKPMVAGQGQGFAFMEDEGDIIRDINLIILLNKHPIINKLNKPHEVNHFSMLAYQSSFDDEGKMYPSLVFVFDIYLRKINWRTNIYQRCTTVGMIDLKKGQFITILSQECISYIKQRFAKNGIFCDILLFMNPNEHYQQKINLLNQYAQCLQRENQAKSYEISLLHEQLNRVDTENTQLRASFNEMRARLEQKERVKNINCSLQTSITFESTATHAQASCQTSEQEEQQCIDQIDQILALAQRINEKDDIIAKYHKECEEMYEAIQKLETSNKELLQHTAADKDLMSKLQERLRREEQKRTLAEQRLEDASYNIYSAGEEAENYKRRAATYEDEIQQLISQNNGLIERVRELQREKNEYYHQIKRMSRVSFGGEGQGKSSVKKSRKVSDQRFKQIEEHLRKVQLENEAIQSNLMISR